MSIFRVPHLAGPPVSAPARTVMTVAAVGMDHAMEFCAVREEEQVEALARALLTLPSVAASEVSRTMIAQSHEEGRTINIRIWVRVDLRFKRYHRMSAKGEREC